MTKRFARPLLVNLCLKLKQTQLNDVGRRDGESSRSALGHSALSEIEAMLAHHKKLPRKEGVSDSVTTVKEQFFSTVLFEDFI
jgi:hypothetical protein